MSFWGFLKIMLVIMAIGTFLSFIMALTPLSLWQWNGFLHSMAFDVHRTLGLRLSIIFISLLAISIFVFRKIWFYRCRECKKFFALKKKARRLLSSQDVSVLMSVDRRNREGEKIGENEQYVPGTRKTYDTPYECKYCGSAKYKIKTVTRANL